LAIVYARGSIAVATRIAAPRMQTHCGTLPSGYPKSNGRLDRGFISLVDGCLVVGPAKTTSRRGSAMSSVDP
jgi:hypothetical protein